ncbi:Rne/Rng family ribonuclease [Roseovarius sp. MBR-6]|uniref:Rne/Rng family ribonuclease n=1 Tax=Roseovarius sp. MBR-6 TaxID=3156459 RepID=UPI0033997DBB
MPKKMLIDATHAEETRVVVVDGNKVEEFDFESENRRQLAGNIYLAKVTRVEPSLQAAFVEYGGNRHGFLAFSEIHPDYYQIPVADREALMAEEEALARAQEDEDERPRARQSVSRSRSRSRSSAEKTKAQDAVVKADVPGPEISGMETIDIAVEDDTETVAEIIPEATSPMERVAETPVEEPLDDATETSRDAPAATVPQEDTRDHAALDDSIESVAEEDDSEDLRPARKPRARRYKIQEVVKVRQIMLVQVVKEERGNKGAALTTYLSLAGRYCVLMPNTARGGGISRKITVAADRKKLKEIAAEIDVPRGAGLIIRTAGAQRTKAEIKRDYEYLQRLWEQIRELTLKSIAPAKIYEEGDLIKRSIRDLYNRDIDEVLVEGERGYRIAKDFMKMIMPSHAKNVKHYLDPMPLFARHQVESYLTGMFNPTVQLPSGGYIVIGVTEALVAIDVNSGRATKEGSIEETALKTNLEAAEEVARQLRLRDLAGLIVIDFIDMDERRNNASVEKRLKDKLKTDRARIQVGRISGFGLMEMSRQRLRPGMLEASTQPCPHCHGTGLIRSDDSMALSILRQIEEEGTRGRSREVLVRAPVAIANFLINQKREHIAQIEQRYGLSVRIEGDPALVSPDFTLEKFKTATRIVPDPVTQFVSGGSALMDEIDSASDEVEVEDEEDDVAEATPETSDDGERPKKKRRRSRSRKRKPRSNGDQEPQESQDDDAQADERLAATPTGEIPEAAAPSQAIADVEAIAETAPETAKPKSRSRSGSRSRKTPPPASAEAETEAAPATKPRSRTVSRSKKPKEAATDTVEAPAVATVEVVPTAETVAEQTPPAPEPVAEQAAPAPEPVVVVEQPEPVAPEQTPDVPDEVPAEGTANAPEPVVEETADTPTPEDDTKPKRRGWWSFG